MKRIAIAAALVGGCHGAPRSTTPAAALSPGLAPYAFYLGTWQCKGTEYAADGETVKSKEDLLVRVAPDITNWIDIHVLDAKGVALTSEILGFDPATKAYRHYWTSTDGTSGSLTSKTGWVGSEIVFEEDNPDPAAKGRMTTKHVDADHYDHVSENDRGAGYKRDYVKQCARVAEPYR